MGRRALAMGGGGAGGGGGGGGSGDVDRSFTHLVNAAAARWGLISGGAFEYGSAFRLYQECKIAGARVGIVDPDDYTFTVWRETVAVHTETVARAAGISDLTFSTAVVVGAGDLGAHYTVSYSRAAAAANSRVSPDPAFILEFLDRMAGPYFQWIGCNFANSVGSRPTAPVAGQAYPIEPILGAP